MVNLSKKQKIILIVVVLIIILLLILYFLKQNNESTYLDLGIDEEIMKKDDEQKNSIEDSEEKNKIIIHVSGSVKKEGIVKIDEGSRIADAIEAAQGLLDEADMSKINLAYMLEDGQKIYIPSIQDTEKKDNAEEIEYITEDCGNNIIISGEIEESKKERSNIMININNATQTELEQLPGVGPSTALNIIEYREANGKFESIEDIKNVRGIGEAKFESIKSNICIK